MTSSLDNFADGKGSAGIRWEEHEAFFRQMLGGIDEPTAPFGLLNWQGEGFESCKARLMLQSGLVLRLRTEAQRIGVTDASLFHLAWALVLACTSGRDDVVFATMLFGASEAAFGDHGMFMNALPLRLSVGATPVREAARETQTMLAKLSHHAHAPLSLAQHCSALPSPERLCFALLDYRSIESFGETGRPCYCNTSPEFDPRAGYPFILRIDDTAEGFQLTAQAPRPFDPVRVCAFTQMALEQLASALKNAPNTPVRELEIIPENERHQVLYGWNETATPFPAECCIHELFEAQVVRLPDAVALVFQDVVLTYAELNARANRLAHYLIALGVKPDTCVGVALGRGPEMVIALLATLKAGGGYVPLDPAYPAERLEFMIKDSNLHLLLTQQTMLATLGRLPVTLPIVMLDANPAPWVTLPAKNPGSAAQGLSSSSLAYVIYTSGSTGKPKGVETRHKNVVALAWRPKFARLAPGQSVLQLAPIAFDAATFEIWGTLLNGARLVIAPAGPLDLEQIAQTIARHKVDTLWLSAGLFRQVMETHPHLLAGVNQLLAGGDVLPVATVRRVKEHYPDLSVINGYGPTETTTFACTHLISSDDVDSGRIPIGRPIANTRIYILNQHGMPVPSGVAGELYIAGAGVARGYLNRPQLTAERFLPDPFSSATLELDQPPYMYKTGDLGRWLPNGTIEFLGRNDTQIKIRGFRIETGEIEARLLTFPGVRDAIVIAHADMPPSGAARTKHKNDPDQSEKRLIAYITGYLDLSAAALRAHVASALPEYMVPAAYVHLDALPLTANGKLDRCALPAPEACAFDKGAYDEPQGLVEPVIAAIWADLLGIERVGRLDNFFALGGHSLLALQFASVLERFLGRVVSPAVIFESPTPALLASFLADHNDKLESEHLVPLVYSRTGTPLFLLHGEDGRLGDYIYLLQHLNRDRPVYGLRLASLETEFGRNLTFERMGTCYAAAIRKVQPKGPYSVCGFSFGGAVAFEVARQLSAQGLEVRLIFLDSFPLTALNLGLFWITLQRNKMREGTFFPSIKRRIGQNLGSLPSPDAGYALRRGQLHRIAKRYQYRPYFGAAALIQCVPPKGEPNLLNADGLNGWACLLKGKVSISRIEESHIDLLKEPTVQKVAKQLDEVLLSFSRSLLPADTNKVTQPLAAIDLPALP